MGLRLYLVLARSISQEKQKERKEKKGRNGTSIERED